jgi:hypothetical protein
MIQKTARGGNEQVDALAELVCLGVAVGATDDHAVCVRVELEQVAGHGVGLQRELARRGDDDHTSALKKLRWHLVSGSGANRRSHTHTHTHTHTNAPLRGMNLRRVRSSIAGTRKASVLPLHR